MTNLKFWRKKTLVIPRLKISNVQSSTFARTIEEKIQDKYEVIQKQLEGVAL